MDYKVIKDNRRKKMVMSVDKDGTVVIKAPKWTRKKNIEHFYRTNLEWISQQKKKIEQNKSNYITLTESDIQNLKKQAKQTLSQKTVYFGGIMGVKPEGVKITSARKRWGSCRKLDNIYTICYSWRTMLLSDRRQDYIVVHELAHIKHFNHSRAFYSEIENVLADWRQIENEIDNFQDIYLY